MADDYFSENESFDFQELHNRVQKVMDDIHQDEELRKREIELDDDVINKLKEAMQEAEQSGLLQFVAVINQINFEQFEQILNEEGIAAANQYLQQNVPDEEALGWLRDPEYVKRQHRVLQDVHEKIDQARQEVEQEMEWEEKEMNKESEMDEILKTIEGRYLNQMKGSMDKVETHVHKNL